MTDMGTGQPPGWYYAQGDPPGTHRYWDGSQWVGGPQPMAGRGTGSTMQGASRYIPEIGRTLADPGQRILARLIDFVVMLVAAIVVVSIAVHDDSSGLGVLLLFALAGVFYEVAFIATRGATPGKMAMGIAVITQDGRFPPGWAPAATRWVMGAIPYVGAIVWIVSLVFLFSDPRSRTVQDRVARTYVVKTR